MGPGLYLKTRLNLLFALLLLCGLTLNVARLFIEAGPRVRAEEESGLRLARDFVQAAIVTIDDAPEPERTLSQLVRGLGNFRHIKVGLGNSLALDAADPDDDGGAPRWFTRMIHPARTMIEMPVLVGHREIGPIVIASNPLDEIDEIWDGIVSQLAIGGGVAVLLFGVTAFIVDRALLPINDLSHALNCLAAGDYAAHVAVSRSPEFAIICRQINALGQALGAAIGDARRLAERIVTLQDDERRDLARELHDEFGPYLFAIRAQASALVAAVGEQPHAAGVIEAARTIQEQVNGLQDSNRTVLARLRPAALDDLGLEAALEALIASWKTTHPTVLVTLENAAPIDDLSDSACLTLYRVVQEGLTNAFRHANPTRIELAIDSLGEDADAPLRVRLDDDGHGLPEAFRNGLGLTGMKERLAALGGGLTIGASEYGGVRLEAVFPPMREN